MAKDYFRTLKAEMKKQHLDTAGLAGLCGCSMTTMYAALRGDREWTLEEMYITLDALSIPYSEMSTIFPRRGMYRGEANSEELDKKQAIYAAAKSFADALIANI